MKATLKKDATITTFYLIGDAMIEGTSNFVGNPPASTRILTIDDIEAIVNEEFIGRSETTTPPDQTGPTGKVNE